MAFIPYQLQLVVKTILPQQSHCYYPFAIIWSFYYFLLSEEFIPQNYSECIEEEPIFNPEYRRIVQGEGPGGLRPREADFVVLRFVQTCSLIRDVAG